MRMIAHTICAALLLMGCAAPLTANDTAGDATSISTKTAARPAGFEAAAVEADWRPWFKSLKRGAILADLAKRRIHIWTPGGAAYRAFPIGVAQTPELAKTGATTVVRKREAPDWRPTPSMRARNPELPHFVGPGPQNPMGAHALYLGWRHYAIHGTNDPASIGRPTTSGCIRLFATHIAWVFEHIGVGAPVVVSGP